MNSQMNLIGADYKLRRNSKEIPNILLKSISLLKLFYLNKQKKMKNKINHFV